jgi:hypothetical protein
MQEIQKNIESIWNEIDNWMNNGVKLISSEKSIVFNFMWEFNKKFEDQIKLVDFETNLFQNFSDGQFLDLFLIYNDGVKDINIGFEFKFPHKKINGSNQTEARQKILNDIKRLNWLVENKKIDLGCFLCVTNETGYINAGNFKIAPEFLTHQEKVYPLNHSLPINNSYPEVVNAINEIKFTWKNIKTAGNRYKIDDEKKYSFLNPIFIKN